MDARHALQGVGARRWWWKAALVALVALALTRAFREPPAQAAEGTLELPPTVDLARLEGLEKRNASRILPGRERQFEDVLAYWWHSNPELFAQLTARLDAPAPGALTCILTRSGGGEHLHRLLQFQGGERARRVDAGELLRRNLTLRRVLGIEERVSLASADGRVLARLPGMLAPERFGPDGLGALVHGSERIGALPPGAVVLLEGLETLHGDTSAAILACIAGGGAEAAGLKDAHFVVLGTSAAFAPWLRTLPAGAAPKLEELAPPRLLTAGDLGYLAQASLALERSRWPEPVEIESFQGLMARHDSLHTCVGHGYLWQQLTESAVLLAGRDEQQVQAALFDKLMARARELQGGDGELDGILGLALAEVAARASAEVDERGCFDVASDATVTIPWGDEQLLVLVGPLLDQSGIAAQDLGALEDPRYRFEPAWIHAHLARGWLERAARSSQPPKVEATPLAKGEPQESDDLTRVRAILAGDDLTPPAQQLGGPRARLSEPPR